MQQQDEAALAQDSINRTSGTRDAAVAQALADASGEPDVSAAINVDDEIVHGTASVNQSLDSNPLEQPSLMVTGRHYLQEEQLPGRAQSQVEHRSTEALDRADEDGFQTREQLHENLRSVQDHNPSVEFATDEFADTHVAPTHQTVPNTSSNNRRGSQGYDVGEMAVDSQAPVRYEAGQGGVAMTEKGCVNASLAHENSQNNLTSGSQQLAHPETPTDRSVVYPPGELQSDSLYQREPILHAQEEAEEAYVLEEDEAQDEEGAPIERDSEEQEAYEDDQEEADEHDEKDVVDEQDEDLYSEDQDQVHQTTAIDHHDPDLADGRPVSKFDESNNLSNRDRDGPSRRLEPVKDSAVLDELERLVVNLNHTAMSNLKNDQFVMAKRLLFKAEQNLVQVDSQCAEFQATTDSIGDLGDAHFAKKAGIGALDALKNRLMGLTYNNLGCLCKQQQDFQGALKFLKRALDYESRLEDYEEEERNLEDLMQMDANDLEFEVDLRTIKCNSAGTILNICAILSKLNKHKQAHEYACEAVAKLRHSMKLTKSQVLQAQRRVAAAQERYDEAQEQAGYNDEENGSSMGVHSEVVRLKTDVERNETNKVELENQWVNLATTAVIAHYNAAVELEFMSSWKQALEQYERAAKLAALAMKAQNPMTAKIKQAVAKMRMKVRNKVQLPDKLPRTSDKAKGRARKSQFSGATVSKAVTSAAGSKQQAQAYKDWQTSVNSTRSSQLNQVQPIRVSDVHPAASNEFAMKDFSGSHSPATIPASAFHPTTSLENDEIKNPMFSIENSHMISSKMTHTRDSVEGQPGARKIGLRTAAKSRGDQSPISLKKIITKLEHSEKLEARQLQPKARFRSQRNPQAFRTAAVNASVQNAEQAVLSVLRERQIGLAPGTAINSIRSTALPGTRTMRNGPQRSTLDAASFSSTGPQPHSTLPSLPLSRGTAGLISQRAARGGTVSGARQTSSPLKLVADRAAATGFPKAQRNANGSRPPNVNMNAWGILPASIESKHDGGPDSVAEVDTTIGGSSVPVKRTSGMEDSRMSSIDGRNLKLSPTRLQMHLSVHQERRLIEQSKRLGANLTKREQDINFFLGHIRRQGAQKARQKLPPATHRVVSPAVGPGPVSTDMASARAQLLLEQSASNLAGSAYLPSKLKKTLKQRHIVGQIKSMQRQLVKEQQLDLNSQLETAFQRQMATWKVEREQQLVSKLREMEEQRAAQDQLESAEREARELEEEAERSRRIPAPIDADFDQVVDEEKMADEAPGVGEPMNAGDDCNDGDQREALSAEQAQEARSLRQESHPRLADKPGSEEMDAGPSIEQDEEEVGNCRPSPHALDKKKVAVLSHSEEQPTKPASPAAPEESQEKHIEHGQTQIEEDAQAESTEKDDQVLYKAIQPGHDTDSVPNEGKPPAIETGSSVHVSEYVSSLHNNTNERDLAADALSGTGQEIELERRSQKQSENMEVEDVVSADTNNAPHNFSGCRTSSGAFMGNTDLKPVDQEEICKGRMNADSALQQYPAAAGAQSKSKTGNRSQNAKSSLAVMMKYEQMNDPNGSTSGQQQESVRAADTAEEQPVSPGEPQAQKSQRASSIAESQLTETVVTLKSEYAEGQPGSTLHEDTIEGWKQRARGGSRLAGTPELTDDATVGGQEGRIGDGPIFIKKSTEFHTSSRRIKHLGSRSSLGGTANPYAGRQELTVERGPPSGQVSDLTHATVGVRYIDDRIASGPDVFADPQAQPRGATRGSIVSSAGPPSDLVCAKRPSGLSVDHGSLAHGSIDASSQVTEHVAEAIPGHVRIKKPKVEGARGRPIESGQATIQNMNSVQAEVTPFMTPRPGLTQGPIRKETLDKATVERSSQDTAQAPRMLPGHIGLSKSPKKRPPVAPPKAKKVVKKAAQQQQHRRYVAGLANAPPKVNSYPQQQVKPADAYARQPTADYSSAGGARPAGGAQNIPAMIHVGQTAGAARTAVASPQVGAKRKVAPMGAGTQQHIMAKSGDHNITLTRTAPMDRPSEQNTEPVLDYAENQIGHTVYPGNAEMSAPTDKVGTEDRVARIAQQISKLDTTLLQFQTATEGAKEDPVLKSTHRSTASKQGLASQKSRDAVTMPATAAAAAAAASGSPAEVSVPSHVRALQDQRLLAQLQSAPGRSRGSMGQQKEGSFGPPSLGPQAPTPQPSEAQQEANYLPDDGSVTRSQGGGPSGDLTEPAQKQSEIMSAAEAVEDVSPSSPPQVTQAARDEQQ